MLWAGLLALLASNSRETRLPPGLHAEKREKKSARA